MPQYHVFVQVDHELDVVVDARDNDEAKFRALRSVEDASWPFNQLILDSKEVTQVWKELRSAALV